MRAGTFTIAALTLGTASLAGAIAVSPSCASGQYTLVPAEDRRPSLNCETGGHLAQPNIVGTPTVIDRNGCISACKNMGVSEGPVCESFGYASGNNSCTLYGTKLIRQKYLSKETNMGVSFSNKRCYKCLAQVCPVGVNAVQNGDFSSPEDTSNTGLPTGWYLAGSGGTATRYCPGAVCFERFEKTDRNANFNYGFFQQLDCMDPFVPYVMGFSAKASTPTFNIEVLIDGISQANIQPPEDVSNTYRFNVRSTATNTTPRLSFNVNGSSIGYVVIGGVSIVQGVTPRR